jgi:hypothetical protein
LSIVIRTYKAAVTTECRDKGYSEFCWQSRFYDHIIRDGKDLDRIRDYIIENPIKWYLDENNPRSTGSITARKRMIVPKEGG